MKLMTRLTALILALILTAAGAMAAEADLIATVNGVNVPIEDAYDEYAYYASLYEMYGMTAELEQLRTDVAMSYAQLEVIYQKFDELGLTVDEKQIRLDAEAEYENAIQSYLTYAEGDTAEAKRESAKTLLAEDGYDEAFFLDYMTSNARVQAVLDHSTADIAVTEEDVKAYYDERVAEDRAIYENDPAMYDEAVSYGESVFYTPEGLRTVKHILVLLDEESQSRMYELEAELESVLLELAAANADVKALTGKKAEIELEMDEIFASIDPRAQEILNKLAAGEDFLALMDEYGEDPGMSNEPTRTNGYLVWADCESWVIPFRDASMALEKPGDVSQPVRTSYGLHIIRYEHAIPSGATPFEDVKDSLSAELLTGLKNERIDALLTEWCEAADVVLYPENLLAMDEAAVEEAE